MLAGLLARSSVGAAVRRVGIVVGGVARLRGFESPSLCLLALCSSASRCSAWHSALLCLLLLQLCLLCRRAVGLLARSLSAALCSPSRCCGLSPLAALVAGPILARSRRLLLCLLASSCLAAVCLVLSVGSPLGWLVAKPLWPVSLSQLAVGCCLVLCSWTLLGCCPLLVCWALLVLGSARLLGSAGLCFCWAAGLLGCCGLGVGSVASALLALSALTGSLMGGRAVRRVAAAAELGALARCRGFCSLAGFLPLLSSVGLPRCCRAAKCCRRLDWALLHGCWALLALLGFWALLPGRRGSVRCLYQSRAVGARRERRAAQAVAQPVPAWLSAESAGLGVGIGGRESVSGLSSTGKDRSGEQADKRTYPGLVSRQQFAKPKARSDATSGSARLPKGQRRQTKPQHENAAHDPNGA